MISRADLQGSPHRPLTVRALTESRKNRAMSRHADGQEGKGGICDEMVRKDEGSGSGRMSSLVSQPSLLRAEVLDHRLLSWRSLFFLEEKRPFFPKAVFHHPHVRLLEAYHCSLPSLFPFTGELVLIPQHSHSVSCDSLSPRTLLAPSEVTPGGLWEDIPPTEAAETLGAWCPTPWVLSCAVILSRGNVSSHSTPECTLQLVDIRQPKTFPKAQWRSICHKWKFWSQREVLVKSSKIQVH